MSREGGSIAEEPNSARGLADILREAGVSSTGAGGRRRRRDADDNAAEADSGSDLPDAGPDVEKTNGTATGAAAGSGALGSYLRSSADASTRAGNRPAPQAPLPPAPRTPPPRTDTGPLPTDGWKGLRAGASDRSEFTVATSMQSAGSSGAATSAADAAAGTSPRSTIVGGPAVQAGPASGSGATEAGATTAPAHANRSPSPLATAAPEDPDEDAAVPLPSGALSWAILVVELLAALGLGVAAWYAFSALWDLLPYVAAFAGPLVVTGLVAVAGALRARTGRNPLGLPTLCILVFAGTVLVVLPAATLIVP